MPKPVTLDRILSTHAKIEAFCDRLTDADMHILTTAATHGLKTMINNTFDIETPQIETDKMRLEMNVNDVISPAHGEMKFKRLWGNVDRCHRKRDKVRVIQLAQNISGLELGEDSLGDGVIELWTKSHTHLSLTDDDLGLLRGDRLKLLQFWIDHVTLNDLQVSKRVDDDWKESTIEYVQIMSRDYDWVHFWEHKSYLQTDYSQPIRSSANPDAVAGHLCKSSSTPQDGYRKHHEIHLVLGDGKSIDDPKRSMWFCATNGVKP